MLNTLTKAGGENRSFTTLIAKQNIIEAKPQSTGAKVLQQAKETTTRAIKTSKKTKKTFFVFFFGPPPKLAANVFLG